MQEVEGEAKWKKKIRRTQGARVCNSLPWSVGRANECDGIATPLVWSFDRRKVWENHSGDYYVILNSIIIDCSETILLAFKKYVFIS